MLTVDDLRAGDIATFKIATFKDGDYTVTGPVRKSECDGRLTFNGYSVTYEGGTPTDWALENFVSAERPVPDLTLSSFLTNVITVGGGRYHYAYPTEIPRTWVATPNDGADFEVIYSGNIEQFEVASFED